MVKTIGVGHVDLDPSKFSWFYVSTNLNIFLSIMLFILLLTLMMASRKIVEGKRGISKEMLYFFLVYPLISPFWVMKSVYNTIMSKKTSWR
jgi:hypothetical protein